MLLIKPDGCAAFCFFDLPNLTYPGTISDYVIVKQRYTVNSDGTLTPILDLDGVELSDQQYFDDDIGESLRKVDDYLPPLDQFDLLIQGTAFAPGGGALQQFECGFEFGDQQKKVRIFGDRQYIEYTDGTSEITAPKGITSMPLRLEHAFGGVDYDLQPFGKGFVYSEKHDPSLNFMFEQLKEVDELEAKMAAEQTSEQSDDLNEDSDQDTIVQLDPAVRDPSLELETDTDAEIALIVDLPNFEPLDQTYQSPFEEFPSIGFSALPSDWSDKLANRIIAQNYDAVLWAMENPDADPSNGPKVEQLSDLMAHAPDQFDRSVYNSAFKDQRFEQPPYGETITMLNMDPKAERFQVHLMTHRPLVYIANAEAVNQPAEYDLNVNSIEIDLAGRTVDVIWKGWVKFEGKTAGENSIKHPYVFIRFVEAGENLDREKILKEFQAEIAPIEELKLGISGPTSEQITQKINDIKEVLIEMGLKAGLSQLELDVLFASDDLEEIEAKLGEKFEEVAANVEAQKKQQEEANEALKAKFAKGT